MASWILHLRIAQALDGYLNPADKTAYYVGTLAPDSGKLNGGFDYVPPKDTTHWKREGVTHEERIECNREFYKKYIADERDEKRLSFYLGYYVHILADSLFVREVIRPYIQKATREVWRANIDKIRAGWYELDFRFIASHKGFLPFEIISAVEDFPNEYLDYFARDDITERITYIKQLYSTSLPDGSTELITLDEPGADRFVDTAAKEIKNLIKNDMTVYRGV